MPGATCLGAGAHSWLPFPGPPEMSYHACVASLDQPSQLAQTSSFFKNRAQPAATLSLPLDGPSSCSSASCAEAWRYKHIYRFLTRWASGASLTRSRSGMPRQWRRHSGQWEPSCTIFLAFTSEREALACCLSLTAAGPGLQRHSAASCAAAICFSRPPRLLQSVACICPAHHVTEQ